MKLMRGLVDVAGGLWHNEGCRPCSRSWSRSKGTEGVLNVAGSRESKSPGIQDRVYVWLVDVIWLRPATITCTLMLNLSFFSEFNKRRFPDDFDYLNIKTISVSVFGSDRSPQSEFNGLL